MVTTSRALHRRRFLLLVLLHIALIEYYNLYEDDEYEDDEYDEFEDDASDGDDEYEDDE